MATESSFDTCRGSKLFRARGGNPVRPFSATSPPGRSVLWSPEFDLGSEYRFLGLVVKTLSGGARIVSDLCARAFRGLEGSEGISLWVERGPGVDLEKLSLVIGH
jgi:hypothetical protein